MISNERYSLDRKRIVNTRISEDEYMRLRSRASSKRVSLSSLMRQGLEPFIQPEDVRSELKSNPTLETNLD